MGIYCRLHRQNGEHHNHGGSNKGIVEELRFYIAIAAYIWLASGIIDTFFVSGSGQ